MLLKAPNLHTTCAKADNHKEHLTNRRIGLNAGKLLGGTSAINAQCLIPPSASNIDAWESLGNPGWNYTTLAPYLKKPFSITLPDEELSAHLKLSWGKEFAEGGKGPVEVSFTDVKENDVGRAWIETFEGLGYGLTASPFSGKSTGAFSVASTVDAKTKTRSDAYTSYYLPVSDRPNLTLIPNATVQSIILQSSDEESVDNTCEPTATGVTYTSPNGTTERISCKREIILCAGVFHSPKLLELSGIGDPEILAKHNIATKIENPYVGTNLQDHPMASISFEAADGLPTGDDMMRKDPSALKIAQDLYSNKQAGPFATNGLASFAYLPTVDFAHDDSALQKYLQTISESETKTIHPLEKPRLQFLRSLLEAGDEGTGQYFLYHAQATSIGVSTLQSLGANPQPGNFITIVSALSHPISSGTTHISSSDISEPPTINHRYLSNPLDLELLARHIRYVESNIATSSPLKQYLKEGGRRVHPASRLGGDLDRAREYVRIACQTNWHSCGTCAMASRENGGVVDEKLRVYGVRNLRVVDASVIPLVPQCNLQTVVYAIAERASDIIKEGN